jgi:hypothetical protein
MLDYVRRYMELGFIVHPLCPPDHMCQSPGKIPFDPYEGCHMPSWQMHKQWELDWWEEMLDLEPGINVGFLCGERSSLLCIDIDDNEGMALLDKFDIPWRCTWQYRTGRGLRVLFRAVGKSESFIFTSDGGTLEILGDGRQSVLPPSVHPNGNCYAWVDGHSPRDCECNTDTEWLTRLDRAGARGATIASDTGLNSDNVNWASTLGDGVSAGTRNVTLASIAGHLLSPGGMAPGEVILWLSLYNEKLVRPPLSENELSAIVKSISKMEATTQETGDREIKRLMVTYGLNRSDAELMWRSSEA